MYQPKPITPATPEETGEIQTRNSKVWYQSRGPRISDLPEYLHRRQAAVDIGFDPDTAALIFVTPDSIEPIPNRDKMDRGFRYERTVFADTQPKPKAKLPNYIKARMDAVKGGMEPEEAIELFPQPKWRPSQEWLEEQEAKNQKEKVPMLLPQ